MAILRYCKVFVFMPVLCLFYAGALNAEVLVASTASEVILKHEQKTDSPAQFVKVENTPTPNTEQPTETNSEESPLTDTTIPTSDSPVKLSLPNQLPQNLNILDITYNNDTAIKAIQRNVNLFANRIRERFSVWLERSARYMDIMKDILREKNMPEELVFLPFIESGFNLHAYSRARAVGPWQFISSTGKRYGLVIDWWRDERKDPVKSTRAAAEYLSDLYGMFGSWKLALAAYNAGEGKIMKALKSTGYDNYWSLLHTRTIKPETKEYVPRYIAAAMIANTPESFGFSDLQYHPPLTFDEVDVYSPVDIEVIARCADTTVAEIRALNPELRRWSTPLNEAVYTIRIPAGTREMFLQRLAQIPEEERFSIERHIVRKGETLKSIASKYSVPVSVVTAMNSISPNTKLSAGDVLYLPPKGKYVADIDDRISVKRASYSSNNDKKKSYTKASTKKQRPSKSKSKTADNKGKRT